MISDVLTVFIYMYQYIHGHSSSYSVQTQDRGVLMQRKTLFTKYNQVSNAIYSKKKRNKREGYINVKKKKCIIHLHFYWLVNIKLSHTYFIYVLLPTLYIHVYIYSICICMYRHVFWV